MDDENKDPEKVIDPADADTTVNSDLPDDQDDNGDDTSDAGDVVPRWKADDIKQRADREKKKRQEAERKLQAYEREREETRRKALADKERYNEATESIAREREEERQKLDARNKKLQELFRERTTGQLYDKVLAETGIPNGFLAKAAYNEVLKELPVIDDVDPEDLESLKFPDIDPQAVKVVARRMRKQAPELFSLNTSGAGGDPPATTKRQHGRQTLDGVVIREGIDPNDPRLPAMLKIARKR